MASSSSVYERQVPGYRFFPTDEELVQYHLKKKICKARLKSEIIGETDVYKCDPEELPGLSILKTKDRQWFFFIPRDSRCLNGSRLRRATPHGFWKTTGNDQNVICNSRSVGIKKTLVFYRGRAPNDKRTDWVMHEYTLEEEELNSCKPPWDNYALCKVFKKDGPGPNKGAHHLAPFEEEDWSRDELEEENFIVEQDNPATQPRELPSADNLRVIMHEPALPTPVFTDYTNDLSQIFGEVPHTDMADTFVTFAETPSFDQQFGAYSSSHLQFYDAPEVTSAPNMYEQIRQISDEGFLEINDLNDLHSYELDNGLSELDRINDTAMFLRDMGCYNQDTDSDVYTNNDDEDHQIHNPLGGDDLGSNICTQIEPGAIIPNISTDIPTDSTLDQNDQVDVSDQNWLISALWAFVDSIPSTPALASENDLVNRAFERMSSFGMVRLNATDINLVARSGTETAKKSCKFTGLVLFSVLGVLFAILWVFLKGEKVNALRKYISL